MDEAREIIIRIDDENVSIISDMDPFELNFWFDVAKKIIMTEAAQQPES